MIMESPFKVGDRVHAMESGGTRPAAFPSGRIGRATIAKTHKDAPCVWIVEFDGHPNYLGTAHYGGMYHLEPCEHDHCREVREESRTYGYGVLEGE